MNSNADGYRRHNLRHSNTSANTSIKTTGANGA